MSNPGNSNHPQGPDRFQIHLQRWNDEVFSMEARAWESQKIASEFGKLGLSSALLLNGGALVAVPAVMQWLNHNGRSLVAVMAIWFPIGIAFAMIAVLLAYLNWMAGKSAYFALARKRARELDLQYANQPLAGDADHQQAARDHAKCNRMIRITQYIGAAFSILSFACFILGVFQFITLANSNTIP